ncbi:hypothetical protein M406DRAFT_330970 [Cryphonectria parasitica EP155]|uniref:Uncharacterized protein n=1 Tax=Cryphonectria parasitica (strain ATCC 38755 / EP155) TaxID=660469 RepID=A0A9P4Y1W3_CRYP1|nr:uncharacterized protein M406DRAFT_330970 [Cryphonectria parasitica EP155]KAF3764640.1 hypothetical protein M406DRAFT_330970 [Cryphonectria parasitica EP155]
MSTRVSAVYFDNGHAQHLAAQYLAACHRQDVETLTIGVAIIASLGTMSVSLLGWGLWERKKRLRSPHLDSKGNDSPALEKKANSSHAADGQSYNRRLHTCDSRSKKGPKSEGVRHPLGELPDAVPAAAEMADFRSTQAVEYRQVEI